MSIPTSNPVLPKAVEIEALLSTGRQLSNPIQLTGFHPSVAIPDDHKLISLNFMEDAPLPDHIKARLQLRDAASFVSYVKAYQSPQTRVLFSSPTVQRLLAGEVASFTALLDYHDAQQQRPARVAHSARYDCPYSIEWLAWLAVSGKGLKQEEFINFVEANGPDIVLPDSATLLEMAHNFESSSAGQLAFKIDRRTGGRVVNISEEIQAGVWSEGKKIPVPEAMVISIPILDGGAEYELNARLSWLAPSGKLTITIHVHRPHIVLRRALADARETIAAGLGLEILTGQLL